MADWESKRGGASGRDVVRGRRVEMPLGTAAGAAAGPILLLQPITIIDQQLPEMGAWLLTLSPITFNGGAQVWAVEDAQPQQILGGADIKLRWRLRWGAGGATFETSGLWPVAGRSFSVSADVIRLDVEPITATAVAASQIPVLSAWAVPAKSVQPYTTDVFQVVSSNPGPFPVALGATHLTVWTTDAGISLRWLGISGAIVSGPIPITTSPLRLTVPNNARAYGLSGGAGTGEVDWFWECVIG